MKNKSLDEQENMIISLMSEGQDEENITLQALDGFLLILSGDGDITYISENITEHLGVSQVIYN